MTLKKNSRRRRAFGYPPRMRARNKGNYVAIEGKLYPVTGKIQEAVASGALQQARRTSAPVQRWNGAGWHPTGKVLHAANKAELQRENASGVRRFNVHVYSEDAHAWSRQGTVDLREHAPMHEVEQVLVKVKVYAPRGADTVTWSRGASPSALVRSYDERPLVKLVPR